MPTIFTHAAVPLAVGLGLGKDVISRRLMVTGVVASMIPDLDGISFWAGIPYASVLGHRGFTHSILFVLFCGLLAATFHRFFKTKASTAFFFIGSVVLSHIFLDAITNGGLGTALLWPFSNERFFLPFRPIEVSPLALTRLFSSRGIQVMTSELKWVWLPMLCLFVLLLPIRSFSKTKRT